MIEGLGREKDAKDDAEEGNDAIQVQAEPMNIEKEEEGRGVDEADHLRSRSG